MAFGNIAKQGVALFRNSPILCTQQVLDPTLSTHLQKMVGFRNIAAHEYQQLNLDILRSIVEKRLEDFLTFSRILIQRFG